MALDPLATVDDLQSRLVGTVDDPVRVEALLRDASAAVRAYTGQQISAGESTARLQMRSGRARLPQQPVAAVTAVADVNGNGIVFQWVAGQFIDVRNIPVANASDGWWRRVSHVDVTYEHGYEEVPDDIIAVVCQMAGRALGTSADQSGVQQERIVSYSYTVGAAAANGAVGMLAGERAVLDRYRLPASPALIS